MFRHHNTHINFVLSDLFHTPGMLNFTNPAGKLATDDDPLLVHKFISQPLFGGGQVILRPGAEKGRQFVRNDTMVSERGFYRTKKCVKYCLAYIFFVKRIGSCLKRRQQKLSNFN